MKKIIITTIVILVSLGAIAFVLTNNKKENEAKIAVVAEKNATVSVRIDTVKTQEITLDFVSNGNFEPVQELKFSAEKSGKITKILVKEGDYVSVGQTVAVVRSDVINVNAQNANAIYQNAVNDFSRFENAFKTGGVTKQQLDQAKLAMVNAKSQLTQANINVGDTRIKAPISGFINAKYIEVGSIISATPATQLFDIVNVSKLKLKVNVSESQVASLKIGSKIDVKASVYPDATFSGKITFIAAKADERLNFPVEIEIANNSSAPLKAGMYGTAEFASNQQKQSLKIVPRDAFIGSVSSNQVFIIENGAAKLKKVTAGRVVGDQVEILDGLNDGQTVIITGQINLQDGTKVEIIK